jgi:alcohol dehydrogenase (NADP+)
MTASFAPAPDGVDPYRVPRKRLWSGDEIPGIGLGTFGSDRFTGEEVAEAVQGAIAVGYRHIDCASVYGNEHLVGRSLEKAMRGGISRDELWITSKVWNDMHGDGDVRRSCEKSLNDLKLDFLDLFLVHWPFPNAHAQGVDVSSRDPHARPYDHEEFMKVWRQMENLVSLGLVRHIGTSNMTIPKLKLLLRDADIRPACNEMELHPHFQQPGLFRFVRDNDIVPIGYCPLGSPNRPARDTTPTDTSPLADPVIIQISRKRNVPPAVLCIKWAIRNGQVPIPFSVNRSHYLSNIQCTVADPLTEDEMRQIAAIDKNCRLIKGQVFLWEGAQSWEDLWDIHGEISR